MTRCVATSEAAIALIDDYTWYRFSRKQLDTPYSIVEALEVFFADLDFDQGDVSVFTACPNGHFGAAYRGAGSGYIRPCV